MKLGLNTSMICKNYLQDALGESDMLEDNLCLN